MLHTKGNFMHAFSEFLHLPPEQKRTDFVHENATSLSKVSRHYFEEIRTSNCDIWFPAVRAQNSGVS